MNRSFVSIYEPLDFYAPSESSDLTLISASKEEYDESDAAIYNIMAKSGLNFTTDWGFQLVPDFAKGTNVVNNMDTLDYLLGKGSVKLEIDREETFEGSGSLKVLFENAQSYHGFSYIFSEARDFSNVISFPMALKFNRVDTIKKVLIVFMTNENSYFQYLIHLQNKSYHH